MTSYEDPELLESAAGTDVGAAIQAVRADAQVPPPERLLDRDDLVLITRPDGVHRDVVDLSEHLEAPHRATGRVLVHSADSFAAAVKARAEGPVTVYRDAVSLDLVAVLNDHVADAPGWRDHRVALQLHATPEWRHWKNRDGKLMSQESFAEHLEDGASEIAEPPVADLLDLAQTLSVHRTVRFRSSKRLTDGRTQFLYEEDDDTTAGEHGTVTVPDEIVLVLRPFVGSPTFRVRALLRRRLNGSQLQLGYKLVRAHEVERTVFDEMADEAVALLQEWDAADDELVVLAGSAS